MHLIWTSFEIPFSFNHHKNLEAYVINVTSQRRKYYSAWKPWITSGSLSILPLRTKGCSISLCCHSWNSGRSLSLITQPAFTEWDYVPGAVLVAEDTEHDMESTFKTLSTGRLTWPPERRSQIPERNPEETSADPGLWSTYCLSNRGPYLPGEVGAMTSTSWGRGNCFSKRWSDLTKEVESVESWIFLF